MSKLESPLPILSYWAETDSCVSSHPVTLAARLFCLCVCALIDLQIAPPSRLTGLLWERCLPSETLISAGSSINLLSKHRVLWWKPCCLTPRLYRITTVRTVRAEEALSLLLRPFLSFAFETLAFPTLLLTHMSRCALIKVLFTVWTCVGCQPRQSRGHSAGSKPVLTSSVDPCHPLVPFPSDNRKHFLFAGPNRHFLSPWGEWMVGYIQNVPLSLFSPAWPLLTKWGSTLSRPVEQQCGEKCLEKVTAFIILLKKTLAVNIKL